METNCPPVGSWVLLTGATGFLGPCLLAELLRRGHRVLAVVRANTPGEARSRLIRGLRPWGRDAEVDLETGRLAALRGEAMSPQWGLPAAIVEHLSSRVTSVIHAAGDTTFHARSNGDPSRTNVQGAREAFRLARVIGCRDWHLISTAFVCGDCDHAREEVPSHPPVFRNEYERGKWVAELESGRAAREQGATLTTYRPSVIVGHSESGVATRFIGIYYLFRATSLLAKWVEQREDVNRYELPLRISADADARPNLVFVDDVAREFVDLLNCAEARGGVYHLTHPAPPANEEIKLALEEYYDLGGGRFTGAGAQSPAGDRSPAEDIFNRMTGAVSAYLFGAPRFDRCRTDGFVARRPAEWTRSRMLRLIGYAESQAWRSGAPLGDSQPGLGGFAAYFERFLPDRLDKSKLGRLVQLSVDARFLMEGGADGDWWCRFRGGRLTAVQRTAGRAADVTYRTTPGAFWRAVGGEATGPELFFAGQAALEGDIERGLKLAAVLQELVDEFPCDRRRLLGDEALAG